MNTQARVNHIPQPAGFVVPDVLPDFPTTPRAGLRLSLEQEQAFGFTVFQLTLDQIQALACDGSVLGNIVGTLEAGQFSFIADNSRFGGVFVELELSPQRNSPGCGSFATIRHPAVRRGTY